MNLYKDSSCPVGQEVGSGTASQFASPGIPLTVPVLPNTSTVFYATATDRGQHLALLLDAVNAVRIGHLR